MKAKIKLHTGTDKRETDICGSNSRAKRIHRVKLNSHHTIQFFALYGLSTTKPDVIFNQKLFRVKIYVYV